MPAYCIADIDVFDPAGYDKYRSQVLPTITKYGGRFLVRGGPFEVREGDWQPHRLVLLEFPSVEQARGWYDSPEYQAIIGLRTSASRGKFVIVEGVA
jgi:uncharacterized protein (DUF1330 family)